MMRIAVTGSKGQVATSLLERAGGNVEVVALGRPAFDLTDRAAVLAGLEAARPDVVVNAAAYTAVDKAEAEEAEAVRVNGEGQGMSRKPRRGSAFPSCISRPTTCSTARSTALIGKTIRPRPTGAYGRSKLAGEKAVAERCEDSVILRTAWVYSPFGANFVRTMLRLNETRDEIGVVADQRGNPTSALDIADAADRDRRKDEGRRVAGVTGRLSYDRLGRGDLGRFR